MTTIGLCWTPRMATPPTISMPPLLMCVLYNIDDALLVDKGHKLLLFAGLPTDPRLHSQPGSEEGELLRLLAHGAAVQGVVRCDADHAPGGQQGQVLRILPHAGDGIGQVPGHYSDVREGGHLGHSQETHLPVGKCRSERNLFLHSRLCPLFVHRFRTSAARPSPIISLCGGQTTAARRIPST